MNLADLTVLGAGFFAGLLLSVRGRVSVEPSSFSIGHGRAERTPSGERRSVTDLSDRLAACACRAELERVVPACFCEAFGSKHAVLLVRDGPGARFLPSYRPELPPFEPSPVLLACLEEQERVWDVEQSGGAAEDRDRAFVRAAQACLVVPIRSGRVLEAIALLGPRTVSRPLSREDRDLMKVIGRQAGLLLHNSRLTQELTQAESIAALARVSSFVVHDLKNQAQTLSFLLHNAEEHLDNAEFQQDMLSAVRRMLADMNRLMQRLKRTPGQAGPLPGTDIRAACDGVVREFARTRTRAFLVCKGERVACAATPSELRTVLVNLIQNGLDAAGDAGTITVETARSGGWGRITIADNGSGMPPEFLEKLFRPFRSTKKNGLGIGLYQSRQIVESFGGFISVSSAPGKGTMFTIDLPAVPLPATADGEQERPRARKAGDGGQDVQALQRRE